MRFFFCRGKHLSMWCKYYFSQGKYRVVLLDQQEILLSCCKYPFFSRQETFPVSFSNTLPKTSFRLGMFQDTSREYLRYFTDLKPREHPRYYMVSAQVVSRNFPRFKSESEIDEKKTSSRTVSAFFYRLLICIQYRGVPVGMKTIKASLAATYQELEDLSCATGPPPDCNYISGRTMLRCGGSTDIQCAA